MEKQGIPQSLAYFSSFSQWRIINILICDTGLVVGISTQKTSCEPMWCGVHFSDCWRLASCPPLICRKLLNNIFRRSWFIIICLDKKNNTPGWEEPTIPRAAIKKRKTENQIRTCFLSYLRKRCRSTWNIIINKIFFKFKCVKRLLNDSNSALE